MLRALVHREIKSMSPSWVYYKWLIVICKRSEVTYSPFEICRSFERFVANIVRRRPRMAQGTALLKIRTYSADVWQPFQLSRSDEDFEELAKGFQPKNAKLWNSWALKIYSEWAKARREHMDELNLTDMSLLTDSRGRLCEELSCILGRKNNSRVKLS